MNLQIQPHGAVFFGNKTELPNEPSLCQKLAQELDTWDLTEEEILEIVPFAMKPLNWFINKNSVRLKQASYPSV